MLESKADVLYSKPFLRTHIQTTHQRTIQTYTAFIHNSVPQKDLRQLSPHASIIGIKRKHVFLLQ
jgi:hypothetical protein